MIMSLILPFGNGIKADSGDLTYNIGSNAVITYKRSENKVYYTRQHFSTGSGIRYYTMYLVVTLSEISEDYNLADPGRYGDYSTCISVSSSGGSQNENSVSKDGDFYWYDSDRNDDGYIKTTYVIDGDVFLNLLNRAESAGITGELYIHHVFAVTGGRNNDDWHTDNKVTNDVPYYRYSDLMKVKWNDTASTHQSQSACMNIAVPYVKPINIDLGNTVTEPWKMINDYVPVTTPYIDRTQSNTYTYNPTATPTPTPSPTPILRIPFIPIPELIRIPGPEISPSVTPSPSATPSPTPTPTPTPRPEIDIDAVSDNLKYVQYINADSSCTQAVLGNTASETISLSITNYDTDVRISFPVDVYASDGLLLPSYTWNRLYPYYTVPDNTSEGKYYVRAAVVNENGSLSSYHEDAFEVSGKLFGLRLTDINSDAQEWRDVFNGETLFYQGNLNEMGNLRGNGTEKVLPLVDGDSPNNETGGILKSGYTWTFKLETYGDRMASAGANILVVPTFYYMGPSLSAGREKVKVYGTDLKEVSGYTEAKRIASSGSVGGSSRTEWTFEYSLPDKWYCTPIGYDVEAYLERKGGITFKEDFWKKSGYLTVSFEIGAYDASGKLIMSYSNTPANVYAGMCNMWVTEGRPGEKKDCYGNVFKLNEGEVILVRLPGSTRDSNGNPSPPTNASEDKIVTRITEY